MAMWLVLTVSSILATFGPSSLVGYGGGAAAVYADQTRVAPTFAFPGAGAPFTDDPLVEGSTVVRAVHVAELRPRINDARVRFGLAAYSFTDPDLAGTTIKAQHLVELRNALAEAYAAGARVAPGYTDPVLQPGMSIKAIHITELRDAILFIENPPYCVITTADLTVGNSTVTLNGCGAGVGGNLAAVNPASMIVGTPTPPVDVVGTCSGTCGAMGTLTTGASPPGDPLAGLAAPPNPGGCVAGVGTTLSPGCYTSISSSVTTLSPGIYYVTGILNVSNLTGSNVMIFLTGFGGLHAANNKFLTLTAPASGPYAGIAIFQDRSDISSFDVGNNFSVSVSGAIYMPGADVVFGNVTSFANTGCTLFIAHGLNTQNASLTLGYQGCAAYRTSATGVPRAEGRARALTPALQSPSSWP